VSACAARGQITAPYYIANSNISTDSSINNSSDICTRFHSASNTDDGADNGTHINSDINTDISPDHFR
jgi:hypothetical protein